MPPGRRRAQAEPEPSALPRPAVTEEPAQPARRMRALVRPLASFTRAEKFAAIAALISLGLVVTYALS